jgi:hypothetical protein
MCKLNTFVVSKLWVGYVGRIMVSKNATYPLIITQFLTESKWESGSRLNRRDLPWALLSNGEASWALCSCVVTFWDRGQGMWMLTVHLATCSCLLAVAHWQRILIFLLLTAFHRFSKKEKKRNLRVQSLASRCLGFHWEFS